MCPMITQAQDQRGPYGPTPISPRPGVNVLHPKSKLLKAGAVSGTVLMAETGLPAQGLTLRLLDNSHLPMGEPSLDDLAAVYAQMDPEDTSAFTLEVITDRHGRYQMKNIPAGDYTLVVQGGASLQSFNYGKFSQWRRQYPRSVDHFYAPSLQSATDEAGDQLTIMAGSKLTRDFLLHEPPLAKKSQFLLNIVYENVPEKTMVSYHRRIWYWFVPIFEDIETSFFRITTSPGYSFYFLDFVSDGEVSTLEADYGWTGLCYTVDNCFYATLVLKNNQYIETPLIYLPLSATPAETTLEYNYLTNTFRQLSP